MESALRVMRNLESQNACFTIDVLGEEITSIEEADYFIEEYERLIEMSVNEKLDFYISIFVIAWQYECTSSATCYAP